MPELYIITGSNGAGKSSIAPIYLPEYIRKSCSVFDGDKLFMQKQRELWASGMRAHKEAKKVALAFVEETFDQLVEKALIDKSDFVYEGHFTNDATWDIPKRFKGQGYAVHLIFLGLMNPELSDLRVIDRSKEGGHYVPPLTVRDNYYGNLEKLNMYYQVIDNLRIFDSSEAEHILLMQLINGKVDYKVAFKKLPAWFRQYLPSLCQLISKAEI
jgi:predicted ABC-type ATPase